MKYLPNQSHRFHYVMPAVIFFLTFGYVFYFKNLINLTFFLGMCFLMLQYRIQRVSVQFFSDFIGFDAKMLMFMLIFCAALSLSSLYGLNPSLGLKNAVYYLKWMFIPFFMVSILVYKIQNFEKYVYWGLTAAAGVIVSSVFYEGIVLGIYRPSGWGSTSYNTTAGLIILLMPFILKNPYVPSSINILWSGALLGALFMTGSRGAIAACIIMGIVMIKINRHELLAFICKSEMKVKVGTLIVIILLTGVGIGSNNDIGNRMSKIVTNPDVWQKNYVGGDRILLWKSTIKMIADYPFTGVGLHNFNPVYQYGGYISPYAREPDLESPHNIFLHVWVESGVVGFVPFVALIFYQLYYVWSCVRKGNRLALAYFIAIIGMCVHGSVDYMLVKREYCQIYWFLNSAVCMSEVNRKEIINGMAHNDNENRK